MTPRKPPRAHGTRSCYVHGPGPGPGKGCRCGECKTARREDEARTSRLKAYGRWAPLVDAGPAREHVRMLSRQGVGHRRVAALSGVSAGGLARLLYPMGGRPPSKRIRAETEAAILAVTPASAAAASAWADATGSRRRMQALTACGWSQAKLAARLSMTLPNFRASLARKRIAAAKAAAMSALYDELWDVAPEQGSRWAKTSAARARNMAAARGWPPPMAWDDDKIDDPSALPAMSWRRGKANRTADLAASYAELAPRGYTHAAAAERLGVTVNALEAALSRARKNQQRGDEAA